MTLENFAKLAGVKIVDCGTGWGGRIGYTTTDAPNCTCCGYKTKLAAYKAWLEDTYGARAGNALLELLRGAPR